MGKAAPSPTPQFMETSSGAVGPPVTDSTSLPPYTIPVFYISVFPALSTPLSECLLWQPPENGEKSGVG